MPSSKQGPNTQEQEACFDWLNRQISLIDPKIIVCLGRIAAMKLIREDLRLPEHGKWFKYGNIDIMAIYHPSAYCVIRTGDLKPLWT